MSPNASRVSESSLYFLIRGFKTCFRSLGFIACLMIWSMLVWSAGLNAQESGVDWSSNEVRKDVLKEKSKYYYPVLYDQLIKGNKILKPRDYRNLYFGIIYTDLYFVREQLESSPAEFISHLGDLSKDPGDRLQSLDSLILKFPVEPMLHFTKYELLSQMGHSQMASVSLGHFEGLVRAILESGDGISCKTAYNIVQREHLDLVLMYHDLDLEKTLDTSTECIEARLHDQSNPMYFNISAVAKAEEIHRSGKENRPRISMMSDSAKN